MPRRINAGNDLLCLLPAACCQRLIDLLSVKFSVQNLIPQIQDPGRSIFLSKILIPIADPLIDHGHQNPFSRQFIV